MVVELRQLDRRTAGELIRLDRRIALEEARQAWGEVRVLTGRGHLSVVAERPDLSMATFARLRGIADQQLRRLDGGDAA